ncbi:MAG TPA: ABC transporter permease [Chthonomonadaceae bacterium]|nr:ABC transporter permease [Chthonomonadaceae bacterium]
MTLLYSIHTAFSNIMVNKLRSALTMLGVIIGVGAVIVMVAIIQGASARITTEFNRLGSSLIIIYYDSNDKEAKKATRSIDGITMDDIHAIEEQCELVKEISAEMPIGSPKAFYGDKQIEVTGNGVQPAYERLRNVQVAHGRFISQQDMDSWASVCVIGEKVRKELFPDEEPLGQSIRVSGLNFTVVGVLAAKGRSLEGDLDKTLYIPLTTVQKRMLGKETVGVIWAQPADATQLNDAMDQVWQLLMRRYDNLPGFHVDSQENILNSINRILSIFGMVLGSIAGLALLVGGIGIMNIMLVSVTERTREIGIRKAIGAKRRDILMQFLIESAVLSGTGGIIGIALGAGFAYAISWVTSLIPAMVDPQTGAKGLAVALPIGFSIGAFLFSASIGVFFGIYPAIRASGLDPIQALRHE